jgi:hypothetical protein
MPFLLSVLKAFSVGRVAALVVPLSGIHGLSIYLTICTFVKQILSLEIPSIL